MGVHHPCRSPDQGSVDAVAHRFDDSGAVDRLVSPRTGFTPKAGLDRAGIETVLALRSRYGEPRLSLTDPDKYLDLSYYEEALGSL